MEQSQEDKDRAGVTQAGAENDKDTWQLSAMSGPAEDPGLGKSSWLLSKVHSLV